MSASRIVLAALIVGLTGFGSWYRLVQRETHAGTATSASPALRAAPAAIRAAPASTRSRDSTNVAQSVSSAIDYSKAFREATSYRRFILSALPAARNGNRDAQYYIHAALAYCDETDKFYFRPRGKTISLEEAIKLRSALPGPSATEAIRRAYDRCHDIDGARDPSWGTADEWLYKATEAGQPLAQMETARKIFLRPIIRVASASKSDDPTIAQGSYSDARALIRNAIETKDPDPQVIFDMGDLLGFLEKGVPNDQLTKEAVTWRYVACLRGLDCGIDAEWYRQFCLWDSNCLPGESGLDYLKRTAPLLNVPDLEERARDLNEKIDAGAWDELGLGN